MSVNSRQIFASCEDADESDNPIEGTLRRATSVVASPVKEQPNTGRTRRDKRRDSISPLTDSDSTVHPSRQLSRRDRERERQKSVSHSDKKAMIPTSQQMRPPVKHARTAPNMQRRESEASYYGVSPVTTAATSRSRPQASHARPVSYYGNPSRPPPANARFYAAQPIPTPPTSFPPPSWSTGPGPTGPFQPPPSQSPIITQSHAAQDYFSRPLEDRFSNGRPQSSIGFRPPRVSSYGDYEYDDEPIPDREVQLTRRPSTSRRRLSKIDDDRKAMPPPGALRRPATTRPTTLAFRPPPSTPISKRRAFEEEDFRGDDALFQDISPLHTYEYGALPHRTRARRPSYGATTAAYDADNIRTEIAGSRSRRNSYYGGQTSSSGSGYEDKIRQATQYQEETGGPPLQLTAESLRKAARNVSSSRSSGSYDESDYRQSATTRTTRSSNENEDVTIKIKGGATLKVGGTEMKCRDGAEINIASRAIPGFVSVSDSRSNYMEEERRLPRIERPPTRARTNSQSGSFSRSLPRYDPPMGYGSYYPREPYQRDIPPYPAYPQPSDNFF
ncbi:hypothetical protein B0T14DRAFT_562351 [Immersiella caudata]|uniref:Uncharacterized protein n=1 Tax=Immersiella caudata TaxID=314043 RepID=A0AA39X363_9PEZI|nr:hypothetical protein B0T14DRAFT_562351 [Immersiella caudata]